jgi:hypothetical protein
MTKTKKKLTYGDVYKSWGDHIIGNKKLVETLKEVLNERDFKKKEN